MADEIAAITDVDCTPRPRRGESAEQFSARMRGYAKAYQVEQRAAGQLNRTAAVCTVTGEDGHVHHVGFCVCGWTGLRAADPEIARREYDAHVCTVQDGDAIHREYRGPVDRRPMSTMIPALASERAAAGVAIPGEESVHVDNTVTGDDAERRMALLEMK